jgi:hypothetical protein
MLINPDYAPKSSKESKPAPPKTVERPSLRNPSKPAVFGGRVCKIIKIYHPRKKEKGQ